MQYRVRKLIENSFKEKTVLLRSTIYLTVMYLLAQMKKHREVVISLQYLIKTISVLLCSNERGWGRSSTTAELFATLTPNFTVYICVLLRNAICDYRGGSKKTARIDNHKGKYLMAYFSICIVNFKYTVDWIRLRDRYFKMEKNPDRTSSLVIVIYRRKPRK